MVDAINVRLPEKLREFVEKQTRPHGTYESVSEYIRALIREDYERQTKVEASGSNSLEPSPSKK
jgi:putative addiction module CopG family antidote